MQLLKPHKDPTQMHQLINSIYNHLLPQFHRILSQPNPCPGLQRCAATMTMPKWENIVCFRYWRSCLLTGKPSADKTWKILKGSEKNPVRKAALESL